jgi:thymidylate synthase
MNKSDKYYIQNLQKIMSEGSLDENPRPKYSDGTPAHSKFITQVFEEYNISKGEFPITTLRNTAIKTGIKEILWIYQKQTSSLEVAREMGINWWDEWNVGDNSIGQRYGATIKRYDLMNKLLDGLVNDPFGRRHIISMYQYVDLEETNGLFPCAYEILCSIRKVGEDKVLDMTLIQRSSDYLMANTINKGQYLALQMMVAGHCGYKVGKFCHLVQNLHIYDRHFEYVSELLKNETTNISPSFRLNGNKNFYDYTLDDFEFFDFDKLKPLSGKLELAI